MIKNLRITTLCFILILFSFSGANAMTIQFQDWGFNPSGAIGTLEDIIQPVDEITLLGRSFVDNASAPADGVLFDEWGTFQATSFQNDGGVVISTLNTSGGFELTSVLVADGVNNATMGSNQLFTFNNATLDIYVDDALNYNTNTDGTPNYLLGADDGVKVASFSLVSGDGNLDFAASGEFDGRIDMLLEATFILPGVWFDPSGVDMSTYIPQDLIIAVVDGNNNLISPSALNEDEMSEFIGLLAVPKVVGEGPFLEDLWTQTDGSVNPGAVPEPGTMMLLGFGLLGIAGISRRRSIK